MITPYSQTKFVEKLITSRNGEVFKVVFCVSLVDGQIKATVVSATPVIEKAEVSLLPILNKKQVSTFVKEIVLNDLIVSPFFNLEFFMSQPTRAPSFSI